MNYRINSDITLEAESYEDAIRQFWKLIAAVGIGCVADPVPYCFVENVESIGERT